MCYDVGFSQYRVAIALYRQSCCFNHVDLLPIECYSAVRLDLVFSPPNSFCKSSGPFLYTPATRPPASVPSFVWCDVMTCFQEFEKERAAGECLVWRHDLFPRVRKRAGGGRVVGWRCNGKEHEGKLCCWWLPPAKLILTRGCREQGVSVIYSHSLCEDGERSAFRVCRNFAFVKQLMKCSWLSSAPKM